MSEGTIGGHDLKLTLDILELMLKSKKKFLDVFIISFLSNLTGKDHSFFLFVQRGLYEKKLGNPALH